MSSLVSSDTPSPTENRLSRLDDNLLTITARTAGSTSNLVRMTIVRLADMRLVLFGAVALEHNEQRALEHFGTPTYLVVPSASYGEDAKLLKTRFPELAVIAPAGVREKLEPTLRVDETSMAFEDASVCLVNIPGTDGTEAALLIETASGVTLVVDGLFSNVDAGDGGRWTLNVDGGGARESLLPAPPFFKTANDRESLRAQLLAWSQIEGLNRIIVSRGAVLTEGAPHALVEAAATLAA
jgi:hypothetical protein